MPGAGVSGISAYGKNANAVPYKNTYVHKIFIQEQRRHAA
jgi:hypothetical protein